MCIFCFSDANMNHLYLLDIHVHVRTLVESREKCPDIKYPRSPLIPSAAVNFIVPGASTHITHNVTFIFQHSETFKDIRIQSQF